MEIKGIDLDTFNREEYLKFIDIIIKYYEIIWDNFEKDYKEYRNEEKRETRI